MIEFMEIKRYPLINQIFENGFQQNKKKIDELKIFNLHTTFKSKTELIFIMYLIISQNMRLKIFFANIVSRKTNARFWLLKTILTKQNQKFWYYQPPSYFQLLLLQKKNTIFTGICRGIVKSENLFFINACFLPTLVVVDQYWTRSSRKTRWECIKGLYN